MFYVSGLRTFYSGGSDSLPGLREEISVQSLSKRITGGCLPRCLTSLSHRQPPQLLEEAGRMNGARGADRVRETKSRREKGRERNNQTPIQEHAPKISAETDIHIQTSCVGLLALAAGSTSKSDKVRKEQKKKKNTVTCFPGPGEGKAFSNCDFRLLFWEGSVNTRARSYLLYYLRTPGTFLSL